MSLFVDLRSEVPLVVDFQGGRREFTTGELVGVAEGEFDLVGVFEKALQDALVLVAVAAAESFEEVLQGLLRCNLAVFEGGRWGTRGDEEHDFAFRERGIGTQGEVGVLHRSGEEGLHGVL